MFFGRRGRQIAFLISLFISLFIQFTGNFGFFNLLTVVLGLWCLDDRFFKRKLPKEIENTAPESDKPRNYNLFSLSLVSLIITFNLYYIANLFVEQNNHANFLNFSLVQEKGETEGKTASFFFETGKVFSRFRIVSPHGVFKGIPKSRIHSEIWIKTKGQDWRKLKLVKGNDLLDFSFSAPFMNRLSFNFFYQSYGIDFRSGLTNINPNTYKLNSWMYNLINGINKGSGDIDKLINVNKKEEVEKIIIIQRLYIPDSFNNKFRHKKDLDTVLIIPGQYFTTPIFSFENITTLNLEKFSINDIKSANGRGIYFLWRDDIVTYIGISQCISNRLFSSRTPHCLTKDFNYYSFINIELENYQLEYYEYNLISLFKPKDNGTNKGFKNYDFLNLSYKEKKEAIDRKEAIDNCMLMMDFYKLDLDLRNYAKT
jgi:hypothetical protein